MSNEHPAWFDGVEAIPDPVYREHMRAYCRLMDVVQPLRDAENARLLAKMDAGTIVVEAASRIDRLAEYEMRMEAKRHAMRAEREAHAERQRQAKIKAEATRLANRQARAAKLEPFRCLSPAPADVQRAQQAWERGRRMAYAHSCGATYSEIARHADLSRERAREIVLRHERMARDPRYRSPLQRYFDEGVVEMTMEIASSPSNPFFELAA